MLEILHLTSCYNIYIHDDLVCKIKKKFQFSRNDFDLDNGFSVKGNFLSTNFDAIELFLLYKIE